MESFHPTADDLERYCLGMVTDEHELTLVEEHLILCGDCVDQAEAVQDYIDQVRIGVSATTLTPSTIPLSFNGTSNLTILPSRHRITAGIECSSLSSVSCKPPSE
jgi:hypothetical protein